MERRRLGNADLTCRSSVSAVTACPVPMDRQMTRSQSPLSAARSISGSIFSTAGSQSLTFCRHCGLIASEQPTVTSASYGQGHNHHLIGETIRGRRHDVVIHSKSGSPRDGSPDAVRGGGDPRYLRQTCEQSLKKLAIETLDVFCMSRVDPNVPVEESV